MKMFAWIEIDKSRCKGCERCTISCPCMLIKLSNEINSMGYNPAMTGPNNKCTGCALCAEMCPDVAIKVYKSHVQ
ncbi:MAG TPA: ferredoxin family protein [Geobacteraceae bacterium]|nr:ferredoxin family protein [Geobacteraceae bacterium]